MYVAWTEGLRNNTDASAGLFWPYPIGFIFGIGHHSIRLPHKLSTPEVRARCRPGDNLVSTLQHYDPFYELNHVSDEPLTTPHEDSQSLTYRDE